MKIFCILGDERAFQSKSPVIFSSVFKRVGIRGMYVPFKVDPGQIGPAMQSLRVLNIDGANITIPYKEAVIPHLDILSEGANIIGAVNTVVRNGKSLKGYNTNAIGFMDTLEEIGFDVPGKTAIVFGTGGIAKAVVFILNWLRAESILIVGRDANSLAGIVNNIGGKALPIRSVNDQSITADILINATSVSSPDESPELASIVDRLDISGCEMIVDMNYGRPINFWEAKAKKESVRFLDGRSILAHQARRSFALWTRIDVETKEFLKAMDEEL
ncbi:MAG: shikimate dehydrogenase [Pseudomonadota bacterium]